LGLSGPLARLFQACQLTLQSGLVLPNRDGALPLQTPIELLADGGSLGPKSLNPDYFAFIDRILPLAASLGLTVALVPTWGRYINGGLHEGPVIFNETNSYEYGLFLGERYPFHPFILGGDTNRYWNMKAPKAVEAGEDVTLLKVHDCGRITESMARGIAEGEKRAVQALPADIKEKVKDYQSFITYHSTQGGWTGQCCAHSHFVSAPLMPLYPGWLPSAPPASGSAQFPEASWLSLDGVQTGHSETQFNENLEPSKNVKMWRSRSPYLPIRQMYNTPRPDGRPRPVIDLEPHYEATHYKFNVRPLSALLAPVHVFVSDHPGCRETSLFGTTQISETERGKACSRGKCGGKLASTVSRLSNCFTVRADTLMGVTPSGSFTIQSQRRTPQSQV
jgi:hypothetical protein